MTIVQLMARLRSLKVKIWLEEDKLKVKAPPGALAPPLKKEMKERKREITQFLQRAAEKTRLVPPQEKVRPKYIPLSQEQKRLWFINQVSPGSPAYNVPYAFFIEGPLEVELLEATLEAIMGRHESLRTSFPLDPEGNPYQHIENRPNLPFESISMAIEDAREAITQLEHEATSFSAKAFKLDTYPLVRFRLYKFSRDLHGFIVNLHHAIADGWSVGIFLREMKDIYALLKEGGMPSAVNSYQYADFTLAQRESAKKPVPSIDYWREKLADAPMVFELPADYPRPAQVDFIGSMVSFDIDEETTQRLIRLNDDTKSSFFMTLYTLFIIQIYAYTQKKDFLIGTACANRATPQLESIIGFFVNTLVLRGKVKPENDFLTLLAETKKHILETFAHQDTPFERIVDVLEIPRDLSRNPLIQTMFIFQNMPMPNMQLGAATMTPVTFDRGSTHLDFSLFMEERNGKLFGILEYSTALFKKSRMTRFTCQFKHLIRCILENPSTPLDRIITLPEEERQLLISNWHKQPTAYEKTKCINTLFEEQASRTPQKTALIFHEEALTYAELNGRANSLARHLDSMGLGPGKRIGLYTERSHLMVIGLLGILKSGAAFVPLDPGFPRDRIKYMIEDAGIETLVTQDSLVAYLNIKRSSLVCLDGDWDAVDHQERSNPRVTIGADSLAYVIYTSGSTGRPKGVQLTHKNWSNFLNSMAKEPGFTEEDTLLAVTTLSFDISNLEIMLPLLRGGTVVVCDRATATDGAALLEILKEFKISVMQATPMTWRLLLNAGWESGSPEHPPILKKILCGGEPLPPELAEALLARGASLWNMYGPTETTVWSTISLIERDHPVDIGRPIDNTQIYILDPRGRLAPIGVPGELHIGGDGLARGYLKRPALTAEKFLPNAFSKIPGKRLYATGDLARYLDDGRLDCLGRIDHQVKVRGYRIELGEIEAVLASHPAVKNAVVIVREDRPGDQRLVGYFTRSGKETPESPALRATLVAQLPDYMVPTAFVALETFPLTPNKKIDRKALPAPEADNGPADDYVAPRNPREEILAGIWADVLHLQRISINDSFFAVGGHSLLATRVMSRVRDAFGAELPVTQIFRTPTLSGLMQAIEAHLHKGEGNLITPCPPEKYGREPTLLFATALVVH